MADIDAGDCTSDGWSDQRRPQTDNPRAMGLSPGHDKCINVYVDPRQNGLIYTYKDNTYDSSFRSKVVSYINIKL